MDGTKVCRYEGPCQNGTRTLLFRPLNKNVWHFYLLHSFVLLFTTLMVGNQSCMRHHVTSRRKETIQPLVVIERRHWITYQVLMTAKLDARTAQLRLEGHLNFMENRLTHLNSRSPLESNERSECKHHRGQGYTTLLNKSLGKSFPTGSAIPKDVRAGLAFQIWSNYESSQSACTDIWFGINARGSAGKILNGKYGFLYLNIRVLKWSVIISMASLWCHISRKM